jgi:hypothetical protein
MSAIASAAPAVLAAGTQIAEMINPIEVFFNSINTSPYFIGIMMLLLNLGGRFLGMEISKGQEKFFQHSWIRKFFIFTVLFIATRNVLVAVFLTIIVLLLLTYLFNENSELYLGGKPKSTEMNDPQKQEQPQPGLSVEEVEILRRLTEKQARYAVATEKKSSTDDKKDASLEQIYFENVSFLNTKY